MIQPEKTNREKAPRRRKLLSGTRGVISLFLAILMVPFVLLAGTILDAARINSAVSVFDAALSNASNSTLGTYDSFLKKRFGLLALKQDISGKPDGYTPEQLLKDTFDKYMEENLGSLSNTFLDPEADVSGLYPLSDPDILKGEILQVSKYAVPVQLLVDGLSLDEWMKELEKMLPGHNFFGAIGSGFKTVDSLVTLSTDLDSLKGKIQIGDDAKDKYEKAYSEFVDAVDEYLHPSEDGDSDEETDSEPDGENQTEKRLEEVKTKRKAYSNAIGGLSSALSAIEKSIEAVQGDIISLTTNIGDTVSSTVTGIYKQKADGIKAQISTQEENLNKAKAEGDADKAAAIQKELDNLKQDKIKEEDKDTDEEVEATVSGINRGLSRLKTDFANYDRSIYGTVVSELNLLQVKVDNYDTEAILGPVDENTYYCEIRSLMTSEQVEQVEAELVDSVTHASIWSVLDAIFGFIEALLQLSFIADPKLSAVIDTAYYNDNFGGLPSDRGGWTSTVNMEDWKQSQEIKNALGGIYANADLEPQEYDLLSCVTMIFTGFDGLRTSICSLFDLTTLLEIGKKLEAIKTYWQSITTGLDNLFSCFSNLFKAGLDKVLLAGYASYSTSDRTSITETDPITQASYNMRGQQTPVVGLELPIIADLQAIVRTVDKDEGSREKCFYGAETEYLIHGSKTEIANQASVFLLVFGLRLIPNLFTVLKNPEVQAIASAAGAASFGILSVVVYVVYVLLEALIDTILLVNGGNIEFWKTGVFLTAGGIGTLISEILSIVPKADKEKMSESLEKREKKFIDARQANVTLDTDKYELTKNKFNSIKYSQILALILFLIPQNLILCRLADIMEMEGVVYYKGVMNAAGEFDLRKSYTYLRVAAQFDMSRFLPIDIDSIMTSKTRLLYRGY